MELICIDLDGTIARAEAVTDPYSIADPMPGAAEFVSKLANRYRVMIHTARINDAWVNTDPEYTAEKVVDVIKAWLKRHGIPDCEVWTGRGKPFAAMYFDDRGFYCVPEEYDKLLDFAIGAGL